MMGRPMALLIQLAVGSSSGSPASHSACRLLRSYLVRYSGSCFLSTRMAVGAENMWVTLYFSTRLHQMPGSGRIGTPSYMMVAMPWISGA